MAISGSTIRLTSGSDGFLLKQQSLDDSDAVSLLLRLYLVPTFSSPSWLIVFGELFLRLTFEPFVLCGPWSKILDLGTFLIWIENVKLIKSSKFSWLYSFLWLWKDGKGRMLQRYRQSTVTIWLKYQIMWPTTNHTMTEEQHVARRVENACTIC